MIQHCFASLNIVLIERSVVLPGKAPKLVAVDRTRRALFVPRIPSASKRKQT
jgi:hypothetical protein